MTHIVQASNSDLNPGDRKGQCVILTTVLQHPTCQLVDLSPLDDVVVDKGRNDGHRDSSTTPVK